MGSVSAKPAILATVLTTLFLPVVNGSGNVVGHAMKKGTTYTVRCVPGKPIPATPRAKSLGVDGIVCKSKIVRRVTVSPDGKRTIRVGNKVIRR